MEFKANNDVHHLALEAQQPECAQGDPHCNKIMGDLCERGCFEITIDLQTMTVCEE